MKIIAILGTSRGDGNTSTFLNLVTENLDEVEVVDLNDYSISPYDYEHGNHDDDFLPIMERVVKADRILFATPVYWYSMSSQLKTFIDRFSDIVRVRKDLGRALKDKEVYLLSTGSGDELPPGYEEPFRLTAEYLDMVYKSSVYAKTLEKGVVSPEDQERALQFAEVLSR